MSDFSQEISDFQHYGIYKYKFDNVGNLTFNSSSTDFSQVFVSLPLLNISYNNVKIESFYDVDFKEFIPQTETSSSADTIDNLESQVQTIQQENITLKTQLDNLILQSQLTSSFVDQQAIKQVILELRKSLGQGRVDSDFSDTFPYTPVNKPTV